MNKKGERGETGYGIYQASMAKAGVGRIREEQARVYLLFTNKVLAGTVNFHASPLTGPTAIDFIITSDQTSVRA